MNRLRRILFFPLIAAMAAAAIGTAATAADSRRPAVVVVPNPWVGHYVGVHVGWDSNEADNGGIVGVFGGWNFAHYNNWIWGLDASLNWTAAASDGAWKGWVRGRLGVPVDQFLLYGTLGAAGFDGSLGWTIGAGADWAVTSVHFVRVD